jgi:hypothetical protein
VRVVGRRNSRIQNGLAKQVEAPEMTTSQLSEPLLGSCIAEVSLAGLRRFLCVPAASDTHQEPDATDQVALGQKETLKERIPRTLLQSELFSVPLLQE